MVAIPIRRTTGTRGGEDGSAQGSVVREVGRSSPLSPLKFYRLSDAGFQVVYQVAERWKGFGYLISH